MKQIQQVLILILCAVFVLTGCSTSPTDFEFQTFSDGSLEIRQLTDDLSLSTVGMMTYGDNGITLRERVLNSSSALLDSGYHYIVSDSLPGLETVYLQYSETAEIQGILLYHGFGYLVIEQDGIQSLIPISPDTELTDIMTASEFLSKAQTYRKNHPDTISGGNGLE